MNKHSQISETVPGQQSPQSTAPDSKPSWRHPARRRILSITAAAVFLLGLISYGGYWWIVGRFFISTDDAYIDADSVTISPKISGYISQVAVEDNQSLHAGQVVVRIDDRDYQTANAAAQGLVAAQQSAIDDLTQQIGEQRLVVAQAEATLVADQAEVIFASQDYQRYEVLSRSGAGTVQSAQAAISAVRQDQAASARDSAGIPAARQQIEVLGAKLAQARALLMQQQAAARQAALNLSYTTITSPITGTVGVRTVRIGNYVEPGTQLMAVVPLAKAYITANFKETQLTNVHPGQPVRISVDSFPNATVHGVVDSIAPASGEEFALLPPDNATGNFTKIVQRVPVKIRIDPHDSLLGRLAPGMSVEPVIDTRPGS